ncbi:hypothetical protein [Streptomyces sp. NPDC050704]|uniref:hypothetical protein n=1 Tax=Streptomyces sp. NPDC050704 TaxID=3157219 RepID=UPI003430E363
MELPEAYEGRAQAEREDGSVVSVSAELTVTEDRTTENPPKGPLPEWTAELGPLTVDGGEPLPLNIGERLVLILDEDRSRWPCYVKRSHERRRQHTVVWYEVRGTSA